jgi:hypothetical protein
MTVTDEMVERAASAMIRDMFADHELPVDEELWHKYVGTAKAALTAALSDRAGGWQDDLENAPRDTAVWILLDGHPYIGFCESANWLNDRDRWFAKSTFIRKGSSMDRRATPTADDIYCCSGIDVKPTHWQPLPSPPSPAGGG